MEIFCFLLGILYTYTGNCYLPLCCFLLFYINPRLSVILLFFLGLVFAWIHQWQLAPKGLPDTEVIPHAIITGTIASIPLQNKHQAKFHFDLKTFNQQPASGLLQLAWYQKIPQLKAGQHWQLSVKLKKPRNFRNPGSADYVNSLLTKHIHWTGYIHSKDNKQLPTSAPYFDWLLIRQKLALSLWNLAPNERIAGIMQALTLNMTTHISQEDWSLFRRTGTIHLFGISGEHIALISGFIFILVRKFWSQSVWCCLRYPAISVASLAGLSLAIPYAFLAGFEPPVQRALFGCFFYTLYFLGKQRISAWQVWRYALFAVLCIEPHAVFMQGFYFSFLAVACLLLTQQRWRFKGYKATLALQLSCLIGLMPLCLYWYSYGSINGFLANLFAIPLVGFLIVPLSLLTLIFSSFHLASLLIIPLSWLIMLLFKGLEWIELLAKMNINASIPSLIYVISLMGGLLLFILLPVKPFQYLAFLWMLIPFFPYTTKIKTGEALIEVLDVGQGLAVSVQTQHHRLLYDTGDQFFQGSDLGKLVILPFYMHQGIKKLDTIIISHPDKDHRGGLKSIEEALPVDQLLVNDRRYYDHGKNCHHYPKWEWDGVNFQFLPIKQQFKDKNNNSCILKIYNANSSLLLTGDIEKPAEAYLIVNYAKQLASDVLIIPHHGSKTSSSYRFLMEISPKYAIASLGFDNRFHFPHAQPLANLKAINSQLYRTDVCGMVSVVLPTKGAMKAPRCF